MFHFIIFAIYDYLKLIYDSLKLFTIENRIGINVARISLVAVAYFCLCSYLQMYENYFKCQGASPQAIKFIRCCHLKIYSGMAIMVYVKPVHQKVCKGWPINSQLINNFQGLAFFYKPFHYQGAWHWKKCHGDTGKTYTARWQSRPFQKASTEQDTNNCHNAKGNIWFYNLPESWNKAMLLNYFSKYQRTGVLGIFLGLSVRVKLSVYRSVYKYRFSVTVRRENIPLYFLVATSVRQKTSVAIQNLD